MSSGGSVETHARAFVDEARGCLDKNWMLDLGHPLLNRVAESFVKAAGVRIIMFSPSPIGISFPSSQQPLSSALLPTADRRSAGGREGILLHGHRR